MTNAVDLEKCFGAGNYAPLPVTVVRGEGVYLWDDEGRRYLYMPGAYSAVGLAALDLLVGDQLIERARDLSEHLLARLNGLTSPAIAEVRGRGLAGIELHQGAASTVDVVEALMRAGVLTKETHRNTVRMAPPFVIEKEEIDEAVDRLAEVLDDITAGVLASSDSH
jgi:ornithine--oxo-acid transaminase